VESSNKRLKYFFAHSIFPDENQADKSMNRLCISVLAIAIHIYRARAAIMTEANKLRMELELTITPALVVA